MILRAKTSTYLKRSTAQSTNLAPQDLVPIQRGQTIDCKPLRQQQKHILVELANPINGIYQWWVFSDHWESQTKSINWSDPSAKVSRYFTVSEVTQNDPRRIPQQEFIQNNILTLAAELDRIREEWGGAIGVTSWYRPPEVNREVGGVPNSQHLNGGAADIYPIEGDIFAFQDWLDRRWERALGYGASRGFVHIDLRPGRIRWDY